MYIGKVKKRTVGINRWSFGIVSWLQRPDYAMMRADES